MGLDAFVLCNCYETGKIRKPPPRPELVFITPAGDLDCRSNDRNELREFDHWRCYETCEHEAGVLLNRHLGNIGLIRVIREELQREPAIFPLLLQKVIYNGIHAGDHLAVSDFNQLKNELSELKAFQSRNRENQEDLNMFYGKMIELLTVALEINKPIVF
jgi:hypothetical protein